MLEGLQKIVSFDETIVAISTPLGHSGIGVVRVSGPDCQRIAKERFQPHSSNSYLQHQRVSVGLWNGPDNKPIDEVVITFFRSPRSYTGEDVLEINAHGNPFILRRIVESVKFAGARLAMPGEFTLRAVANGKMDLLQAEAVREFIEVQTELQAKTVRSQMEGILSRHVRPIKDVLVNQIAHLEAGIDFAEDDVAVPENRSIIENVRPLRARLDALKDSFRYGELLSRGVKITILGKPNVGKSSLFNALLSAERAIVTDIPGTTRDVLTETISLDGVPISFADTAGIRNTTDVVESIGMSRAYESLSRTDFALIVIDGSSALDVDDEHALQMTVGHPHVVVINKSDLPSVADMNSLEGRGRVLVSAKTGEGLDALRDALRAFLLSQKTSLNDDLILTNVRQHEVVARASAALKAAERGLTSSVPHEMVLLDLYRGLEALNELTGDVVRDDILERIFSTFCVGK